MKTTLEERFNEQFPFELETTIELQGKTDEPWAKIDTKENVIAFIKSELSNQRKEIREAVEKLKIKESHIGIGGLYTAKVEMEVNIALDQVLSLTELKE